MEYRIPLAGPLAVALFTDTGLNRASFAGQLLVNSEIRDQLNSMFPQAGFGSRVVIQPDSQIIRMSSGIELQVIVPKIRAPIRLYWAYNPLRRDQPCALARAEFTVCSSVRQPFDRYLFPNRTTYAGALASFASSTLSPEPRSVVRAAIGFSF